MTATKIAQYASRSNTLRHLLFLRFPNWVAAPVVDRPRASFQFGRASARLPLHMAQLRL
jgi:hypothetical protein